MASPNYSKGLPGREPVKFILAATFRKEEILAEATRLLQLDYGRIDTQSAPFDFHFTDYYEDEMGKNLRKQFFSFQLLGDAEKLPDLKSRTLALEKTFSQSEKRQVNLDPAYLELAKLVVASTKNFDHRIYLGNDIYADLQLRYRHNQFVPNEWTYPDYKSELAIGFLTKVRNIYFDQLRNVSSDLQ